MRRLALVAMLLWTATLALAGEEGAPAAARDREALLRDFVAGQHGLLPYTTERAVPFLIRVALDRKLEEAGRGAGLGGGWGREAPEWQAADRRAEALSHELESAFDMRLDAAEARELLADVSDADLESLVAFQRSDLALRVTKATDLALAALLLSTVDGKPLPPALEAARGAVSIELADRRAEARIAPKDQAELLRIFDKPAYERVVLAARQRLQSRLQGGNPVQRLDALLAREAEAAMEAFKQRSAS
ncbi:MAG: hypothetical protein ACK5YQ_06485 [Betaproteobacteria bacterium]